MVTSYPSSFSGLFFLVLFSASYAQQRPIAHYVTPEEQLFPREIWCEIAQYLPANNQFINQLARKFPLWQKLYERMIESFVDTQPFYPTADDIQDIVAQHFTKTRAPFSAQEFQDHIKQALILFIQKYPFGRYKKSIDKRMIGDFRKQLSLELRDEQRWAALSNQALTSEMESLSIAAVDQIIDKLTLYRKFIDRSLQYLGTAHGTAVERDKYIGRYVKKTVSCHSILDTYFRAFSVGFAILLLVESLFYRFGPQFETAQTINKYFAIATASLQVVFSLAFLYTSLCKQVVPYAQKYHDDRNLDTLKDYLQALRLKLAKLEASIVAYQIENRV